MYSLNFVKAYLCECECGWVLDKEDPEVCWNCGSTGPHLLCSTSQSTYRFARIAPADEDYLFSEIGGIIEGNE